MYSGISIKWLLGSKKNHITQRVYLKSNQKNVLSFSNSNSNFTWTCIELIICSILSINISANRGFYGFPAINLHLFVIWISSKFIAGSSNEIIRLMFRFMHALLNFHLNCFCIFNMHLTISKKARSFW